MKGSLMLIILFISSFGFGQNPARFDELDQKMDQIPSTMETSTTSIADYINTNFVGSQDKIRAAFYWAASRIAYDVESLDDVKQALQTPEEKVEATLKTRKGVCVHYAEVFKDIATKLDIETVLISGYNKVQGKIATLSHIWCASKINDTWYLFDPTWGSGYVNNNKYVRKINNRYFKAEPQSLLTTHMPFDYLWQFSEYPITNQEFYDGITARSDRRIKFDFRNEVEAYQRLSVTDQASQSAKRIEANGVKNSLIAERLDYEKYRILHEKDKDNYLKMQEIIANFKEAGNKFKEFLNYRNRKFTPLVSDEQIKSKIQVPYDIIVQCERDLKEVKDVQKSNIGNFNTIKSSIFDAKKTFETHLNFVNEYLATAKPEREKLFYKRVVKKG